MALSRSVVVFVLMLFCPAIALAQPAQVSQRPVENEFLSRLLASTEEDQALGLLRDHAQLITLDLCYRLSLEARRATDSPKQVLRLQLAREAALISNNQRVLPDVPLYLIGRYYFENGKVRKAIDENLRSKQAFDSLGSKVDLIYLLGDLATFYLAAGDYKNSKTYALDCENAASSSLATDDQWVKAVAQDGLCMAWSILGSVYTVEGQYDAALTHIQRALALSRERALKDPSQALYIVDTLNNLAHLNKSVRNYSRVLQSLTEAREIAARLGRKDRLCRIFNSLGILYLDQGNHTSALRWLQQSLDLARELRMNVTAATTLFNIGLCYQRQKDYEKAMAAYYQSLATAGSCGALDAVLAAKEGLGAALLERGDPRMALTHVLDASRLAAQQGDKGRLAELLYFRGEVFYSLGDHAQALQLAEAAYKTATELALPYPSYVASTLKGKVMTAQRDYGPAYEALSHAIEIIERLRSQAAGQENQRALFFQDKLAPYHLMIDLLVAQARTGEALEWAERAKGRVLLDLARAGRVNVNSLMTDQERERDRKLNAEVVSLNAQIYAARQQEQREPARLAELTARLDRVRLEYGTHRDGLYAAHPELAMRRAEERQVSIDDLAALFPDSETALLEFAVLEDKAYLFVVTKAKSDDPSNGRLDIHSFAIGSKRSDLKTLVETFRERIANPRFLAHTAARQLYDLLLGPAAALLKNKSALIVVPDGILWDLPFQALRLPTNRYLIEDHAISYAPSLSVLSEIRKKKLKLQPVAISQTQRGLTAKHSATRDLLAFGNPQLSTQTVEQVRSVRRDENLLPLPQAEREVKSLSQLYGPRSSNVYIGADAREDKAKQELGKYRVLHFATHGVLDSNNPMYSHIVLSRAEGTKEDGLLEAWELMQMNIDADIAVLSACETARGQIGAGEGVIGLSWAFFVAGCPTTVVSQWQVDSASTTELMIEFHKKLLSGSKRSHAGRPHMTKAEALRQAMLTVLKRGRFKTPYFWAGFIVVGDGS